MIRKRSDYWQVKVYAGLDLLTGKERYEYGSWRDGEPSFFRVNAWRDQAENIAESLSKGNRAVVLGRLRTRSWETPEGEKRSVTEIDADEVAPSLRWAIAKPERAERSRNGERGAERGQFNDPTPS
ncbi:MAG TPA: single-stranded DNA-binding protein [Actinomycetes bacterium]